jgi:hypothetical protein
MKRPLILQRMKPHIVGQATEWEDMQYLYTDLDYLHACKSIRDCKVGNRWRVINWRKTKVIATQATLRLQSGQEL